MIAIDTAEAIGRQNSDASEAATWIEWLSLTGFRNYRHLRVEAGPGPVVLYGANGSGKTNLLEAVSLLSPGRGLRRAAYPDLTCAAAEAPWAVAARVHVDGNWSDVGTGLQAGKVGGERTGRLVRINGTQQTGSGALGFVQMIWLTPASDGLFTAAASERRRFLDRLTAAFDPGHATRAGHFERAMRQRNRLLDDGVTAPARYEGLEILMAEAAVAMAAARVETVAALNAEMAARRARDPQSPFPWADIELEGDIEATLASHAAVDAEDNYRRRLASSRERDRAAGRTLEGPHRSDLVVSHGPKQMPARLCSTGEQKALLVGMVLAHAEQLTYRNGGAAPVMLLDEIAAHLDVVRRRALYRDIDRLGAQAWLTGTDREAFEGLPEATIFLNVEDGRVRSA
ncbi:MAG: DNA replication/repair protein RecF [Hyphomicrobiaceae bacterium]|nr:DNA replication/repair protein RecF [Hyphomicrobiaceae bacterium]